MGSDETAKQAPIIRNLLTEELLRTELMPYLPSGLRISKGEVIKEGRSSGDCDLIIYEPPVIYQYGSITVVPYPNAKAIIDVEVHGERFLKALMRNTFEASKHVEKKLREVNKLKDFTDRVICVGLHGHGRSKVFKWWLGSKDDYKGPTPIFLLYTQHDQKIIEGEFERLITEISTLWENRRKGDGH